MSWVKVVAAAQAGEKEREEGHQGDDGEGRVKEQLVFRDHAFFHRVVFSYTPIPDIGFWGMFIRSK